MAFLFEPAIFSNDPLSVLPVAAAFLLAGVVKGVVGLGLPTVAMALLALRMSPADAAALLVVPSLVTNLWQLRPLSGIVRMARRLAPMSVGVVIGTLAGAWVMGAPRGAWAGIALGAALLAYASWGLVGAQWVVRPATEPWLGPLVGAATGWLTAATGVFVLPAVPYLRALGFRRDELVQAMGLSFTVSTLALGAGLAVGAHFSAPAAGNSLLMLAPALAGMSIGQRLRNSLSPAVFQPCFLLVIAALGAYMVLRPLVAT